MKKKEKTENKTIKIGNYIIVLSIMAITILVTFYLRNWYRQDRAYQLTIPVIRGSLMEINYSELGNYVSENQSKIIYVCVSNDENCRSFESKLKRFIEKKHLKDELTYLNVSDIEDKSDFLKQFNEDFKTENPLKSYPAFIVFDGGKVVDIIQDSSTNHLDMSDVERLLDLHLEEDGE